MKSFLDTSVLIAAFNTSHPHHPPSFALLQGCAKPDACCGAHSLAEVYATLTGMPAAQRADPDHVLLFLGEIRDRLALIALDEGEYVAAVEAAAAAGLASGAIYDALLGHCALKAGAETIYTWNTRDFLRLPPAISRRVKTPDGAER
jgi:predicted nucleic acid-binding protein